MGRIKYYKEPLQRVTNFSAFKCRSPCSRRLIRCIELVPAARQRLPHLRKQGVFFLRLVRTRLQYATTLVVYSREKRVPPLLDSPPPCPRLSSRPGAPVSLLFLYANTETIPMSGSEVYTSVGCPSPLQLL